MTKTERQDIKIEIRSRKLVIAKLNTAIKYLQRKADRQHREKATRREKMLTYKTYDEAQEAYGWGFITEKEFYEIVDFLEKSQSAVDKPSAEDIAISMLSGWRKLCLSDIDSLEFELLPEAKQNEIREKNYEILMKRKEREGARRA